MTFNSTAISWSIATLLLVSIIAFSAHRVHASPNGFAQHHQKMSHGFGPHRLFKMIHHLDLSREQREKVGLVMDKHRPQMRTFMLDMLDAKKALQDILNDPNYSPTAVESLAKSQAANAESMFLATASTFAEIGGILTPEQRKQVSKKMDKRRGWGRGEHHRSGDKGSRRHSDEGESARHDL